VSEICPRNTPGKYPGAYYKNQSEARRASVMKVFYNIDIGWKGDVTSCIGFFLTLHGFFAISLDKDSSGKSNKPTKSNEDKNENPKEA